jgi:hypothetical protein
MHVVECSLLSLNQLEFASKVGRSICLLREGLNDIQSTLLYSHSP